MASQDIPRDLGIWLCPSGSDVYKLRASASIWGIEASLLFTQGPNFITLEQNPPKPSSPRGLLWISSAFKCLQLTTHSEVCKLLDYTLRRFSGRSVNGCHVFSLNEKSPLSARESFITAPDISFPHLLSRGDNSTYLSRINEIIHVKRLPQCLECKGHSYCECYYSLSLLYILHGTRTLFVIHITHTACLVGESTVSGTLKQKSKLQNQWTAKSSRLRQHLAP